jgi:subtilisin family serine protease
MKAVTEFMHNILNREWSLVLPAVLLAAVATAQERIIPNDPYYRSQITFHAAAGEAVVSDRSSREGTHTYQVGAGVTLDMERAWAITTGSKSVVVAILDDGFCYEMPDVRDNIWHNPGESGADRSGLAKETNGKDDDGNGYVDDVIGWDFVFDTPDPSCYVFDGMDRNRIAPYWHSLHAMGIIGAKGNNGIGVAGINWNVSMMLLRIGVQGIGRNEIDTRRVDRVIRAIRYAADNGARVLNDSGFVQGAPPEKLRELREAIDYAGKRNLLLVAGAGNDKNDLDDDANCKYQPQCFEAPNLMKVAEADFSGGLYVASPPWIGGSNFGARRVEIAAIGANFTTGIQNGLPIYEITGGTSNAGPVVAGVAALMLAVNPGLTAIELKQLLLESATPVAALRGKVACGGIVNAYRAVVAAKNRLK